jgi:RuvB-like protein 2
LKHWPARSARACLKRKGKVVGIDDVSRVYGFFLELKRSMQYLVEYQGQYMFSEGLGESRWR